MICPHCSANLLRRQRAGRRCSTCRRPFALDPKDNALHLHDLRMRRLVSVLTDPRTGRLAAADRPAVGPLGYTADQLRYAAARKVLADPPAGSGPWGGVAVLAVLGVVVASLAASAGPGAVVAVLFVAAGICVLIVRNHAAAAPRRRHPGDPISADGFGGLLDAWRAVYGGPPPGLLPPRPVVPVPPPGRPGAALYCTDPPTVDFLAAAGLARDRGVLLIPADGSWPPAALVDALRTDAALPVLALHDADPAGAKLASRLRVALPPGTRVLDAGLDPRTAAAAGPPVRRAPDPALIDALGPGDHGWLADGNTLPLAALRPAALLRAVERSVDRAADPDRARAAGLGFLAWPEPGR